MSEEIDLDGPSPWWPCPECGGIRFHTTCVFERGRWIEYPPDDPVWEAMDPPDGRPTGVVCNHVVCEQCGHEFDIHGHYGWPEPMGFQSD